MFQILVLGSACARHPTTLEQIEAAPFRPTFKVRDTAYKYGRYSDRLKTISLSDLVLFHGHLCGGLVETAVMARVAFDQLFADTLGVIDRTDGEIVSNNSACGGDVLEYLSGARYRFRSHCIDKGLGGDSIVLRRISTGTVVRAFLRPAMYPHKVRATMRKIESGRFSSQDIKDFGRLQREFSLRLLSRSPETSVRAEKLKSYDCRHSGLHPSTRRRDNDYKQ